MRDRDRELIAALVERRLEDETEARALVTSSPEHRAEYEAQKLAYTALREAGTEPMTETERAHLHRDVWSTFRTEVGAKPARTPWYYRLAPVAALLFVVVGLVAVLNQPRGDSGAETAGAPTQTTVAAEAATEDAADEADATATTTAAPGALQEEGQDGAGEGETAATTAAASEPPVTLASDETASFYAAEADKVRESDFSTTRSAAPGEEDAAESPEQSCVNVAAENADLGEYVFVTTVTLPTDGAEVAVAVPENAELATAPVAFVNLEAQICELAYLDE